MTPAESVARDCAELATLAPLLTPALRRDQTGTGRYGRLERLSLFNTDVHLARSRILAEAPAATIHTAQLLHETWQWRPLGTCLDALPRFADRMHALGMVTELNRLAGLTGSWRRQIKRALGLRTQDIQVPAHCPLCETVPAGDLYLAGIEAKVNARDLTAPPVWDDHDRRVYCTTCGAVWGRGEWGLLEQQIAGQQVTA